jgi:site-specific DNA recombinase
MANADTKTLRCAIYTRKSTEEGLEQAFNSLDAQREAGEAYAKSQDWQVIPEHYDDGGFTVRISAHCEHLISPRVNT